MTQTSRTAIRRRLQAAPPRGFALAAVLWLLAGLAVLVTSVSVSMMTVARTNRDLDARLRIELAAQSALASVAYLYLTQKTLGVGAKVGDVVLPLDGRSPLRLDGDMQVELQDQLGLIALNSPQGDNLRRLLVGCGATEAQSDALADSLLDYVDEDAMKRLNGAEAFDYASQGLKPPRNALLSSRDELWQVMGWKRFREQWTQQGCAQWVSVASAAFVNLWTAPLPVLLALGMGADEAAAALAERDRMKDLPMLSPMLLAFRDRQGGSLEALSRFAVRSQGELRVTVSSPSTAVSRRFVLSRVGASHLAPFLVTEEEWLSADAETSAASSLLNADLPLAALSDYIALTLALNPATNAQTTALPAQRP